MKKIIINILDENRERLDIIDVAESVLWTKKYQDVGGCVIKLPPTLYWVNLFISEAKYLSRDDDDMVCEIKKLHIATDNTTNKTTLTVTALSCETLLNQRIVWNMLSYNTQAEIYIRRLVLDNFISSDNKDRNVDFIKLGTLKQYPEMINKQVTYDEVLPTIIDICKTYGFGFRFLLGDDNNFYFDVYRGKDVSTSQEENSYVVFSKEFNNLQSFEWEIDLSGFKNVCLVGGEGEGTLRKTKAVGTASGIKRYEMFADAKSLSSEDGAIVDYDEVLNESGVEALSTRPIVTKFACKIDVEQYEYKVDFDLGYIVTVEADYGLTVDARIIEIVEAEDVNGYRVTANLEL